MYLDIYEDGQRRYEVLKLYLYPETNDTIKAQNRDTRKLAEVIRGKRLVEAQNTAYGFAQRRDKVLLLPTFDKFRKGRNSNIYGTLSMHLHTICPEGMKVAQIKEKWVIDFVRYLRGKNISDNSISEYLALFRVFWGWCVRKGIVVGNPFEGVQLNTQQAVREYLTLEELQQLASTPTKYKVREPFLFSCFTGLRFSDIKALRWSDVEQFGGRTRIVFRQKKTKAQEYMDLNAQAVALMGVRKENTAFIFDVGKAQNTGVINRQLRIWAKSAGINKYITFHCARHTFATMLLTLGTDIYVVSKLLGHTDISTTQIYAKIVDKRKQEAVDRIPQML